MYEVITKHNIIHSEIVRDKHSFWSVWSKNVWKMTSVTSPIGCISQMKRGNCFHSLTISWLFCMRSCKNAWKIKPEAEIKKRGKKALLSTRSAVVPGFLSDAAVTRRRHRNPSLFCVAIWEKPPGRLMNTCHMPTLSLTGHRAEQSRAEPLFTSSHDEASCTRSYATQPLRLLIGASGFSREDARWGRGQRSRSGSVDWIKREITREGGK